MKNEGCLFGISWDGFFRLRSWGGETFTTLANWATPITGPDQTNCLGLMVRSIELPMIINGVAFMVTVSDVPYWDLP